MKRFGSRAWPSVAAAVVLTAGAGSARAQNTPLEDPKIQRADALFDEAQRLRDSDPAQACAKFEESYRLNGEAIGTALNVALCDEQSDRVASAVAKFIDIRDRSKEQGLPAYLRTAEQHLVTLQPLVPHLKIKLSEALPGTSVVIDSQLITPSTFASIAVDPGERVIVVSAPNRLPYRTKITVAKSEQRDVVVPALAKAVIVRSSRPLIGEITAATGLAAAATGLGIGLYARHQYNQQFDGDTPSCVKVNGKSLCSARGQEKTDHARTLGNVGTIVGVAGVAVAIGGAVLWYVSPRTTRPAAERHASLTVVPDVSPDGVGLTALGHF
ncbi:MAG TPA: hypothetical protein VFP84_34340 [Kofleriaceae bacterium]|nr:hypothetical protein [Kofleriaceae bacterium]